MRPVANVGWLKRQRGEVVLADVRWYLDGRSGRDAYEAGHLPGAAFVDLERWLAAEASPEAGRHPLPDPELFAAGMSGLGIGDQDVVVAYDDAGGVIAARLVWMLRATGHQAALLDGGLHTFGGELERSVTRRPRAVCSTRPWPTRLLAEIEDATRPSNVVIDAREPERCAGEHEPLDPRPGHIPGARNVPCRQNLDEQHKLLPVEELRKRFASAGVTDASRVVSYCGSGVTACHNRSPSSTPDSASVASTPAPGLSTAAGKNLPVAVGDQP